MSGAAERGGRWFWLGTLGATVYVLGLSATVLAMIRNPAAVLTVSSPVTQLFTITAAFLSWRVTRNPYLNARTRGAWKWVMAGLLVLSVSNVSYAVHWGFFPGPPEYLRFAVTPLLVTGLLRMPRRQQGRRETIKVLLDGSTVAASTCAFVLYFQVVPALASHRAEVHRVVAATMFPLSGLVLAFGLAVVLLRGSDAATRTPIRIFALAAIPWLSGDFVLSYRLSHLGASNATGPQMLCFMTMNFLLAVAAASQIRNARRSALDEGHGPVVTVSHLPYAAIAAIYGLFFYVAVRRDAMLPWGALVLCGFVLTTLVTVRQIVVQRENHRMAVTDGLTGLANRVRLHELLGIALGRAGRQGQTTAVLLCDLDGFKQINDTMGHAAGDQLLVAYGQILRRATLGSDVVARLGGDEFAVVLLDIRSRENAEIVAERVLAEAGRPVLIGDTPVQIRGSIGVGLAAPGECTADELLHRADTAMYEAKRAARTG